MTRLTIHKIPNPNYVEIFFEKKKPIVLDTAWTHIKFMFSHIPKNGVDNNDLVQKIVSSGVHKNIELIQQKNIVTRYDHEHDSLLMSNPFYEQLTKTVRRQLELYIF